MTHRIQERLPPLNQSWNQACLCQTQHNPDFFTLRTGRKRGDQWERASQDEFEKQQPRKQEGQRGGIEVGGKDGRALGGGSRGR